MYLSNFALVVLGADKEDNIEDESLRLRLKDKDGECTSSLVDEDEAVADLAGAGYIIRSGFDQYSFL